VISPARADPRPPLDTVPNTAEPGPLVTSESMPSPSPFCSTWMAGASVDDSNPLTASKGIPVPEFESVRVASELESSDVSSVPASLYTPYCMFPVVASAGLAAATTNAVPPATAPAAKRAPCLSRPRRPVTPSSEVRPPVLVRTGRRRARRLLQPGKTGLHRFPPAARHLHHLIIQATGHGGQPAQVAGTRGERHRRGARVVRFRIAFPIRSCKCEPAHTRPTATTNRIGCNAQ
jgi:hypothetical protein